MRRTLLVLSMVIGASLAAQVIVEGPPIKPEEKRLLVTAESLTAWGFGGIDPSLQKFRTAYNTGFESLRVISEYEQRPSAANGHTRINLQSSAEIYPTEEQARRSFAIEISGTMKGIARVAGVTLADASPLLTMGDENYSAYMMVRGEKRGNILIFRRGRVLHSMTISGVYFVRHREVRKLLEPIYNESVRQFPR
ncbi:MAG TPA: hypothetical protein VKB93_27395 [Thermoanaerobaculia bacterium]|nr:hypothetical protein [Thermoanaerobaculia bacterium]